MTALAAALTVTSCGLGGHDTIESLRERQGAADGIQVYDSLDDLLGNTRYRFGDAADKPLTVAVVAGRFASVEPGRAFTVAGGDAPGGDVADFDTDDAVWKTVEATFVVDHVVSGEGQPGDRLRVGLSFGPDVDPDRVDDDLRDLGRTVLFLDRSEVFAYDPLLHGIAADGAMIATVAADGTLGLPAMSPADAHPLLAGTPTLASLDAAAAGPGRLMITDPATFEVVQEITDEP